MVSSLLPMACEECPPSKRLKFTLPNEHSMHNDVSTACSGPPEETPVETEAEMEIIQPHPLRIKPSGNAFTSSTNLRDTSCGRLAIFPDELILQVLGYLSANDLNALAATSKGVYGFSRAEELWKPLFIEYVKRTACLPLCWMPWPNIDCNYSSRGTKTLSTAVPTFSTLHTGSRSVSVNFII